MTAAAPDPLPALDYEALWNALPHPALVLDPAGGVSACNAAAELFFSTSARAWAGKPFSDVAPPASRLASLVEQARRHTASVAERGVEIAWGDVAPQLVDVSVVPLREAAPDCFLLLVQPRGIAEKMTRSLAHRSAARSVTGMAAALAHEIRNPLAAISGAAQLLQMAASDQEAELAQLIQDEAGRIRGLVDRMEHFTDARPPEQRPVNLHDVLRQMRRAAEAGFAGAARFVEEYDPSLPPTRGDRDQLARAFQNLMKNAAEAAGDGGCVTLRTAYRPGVRMAASEAGGARRSLPLEVAISDDGPGIPDDLSPHIFEPFVTSKAGGAGLGLALVSKIVADHGGVIECQSAPGRTTFRMLLPVCDDPEDAEATP